MKNKIASTVKILGALSKKWLRQDFFYRQKAIKKLVKDSGFSPKMAAAIIDSIFQELTPEKLLKFLRHEIGNEKYLEGFHKNPITGIRQKALAPRRITHIFSANLPNPSISSLVFGVLLGSANQVRLSARDAGFLGVYLESLRKENPGLSRQCRIVSGKNSKTFDKGLKDSDLVLAYGSDETLEKIRSKVPVKNIFVGYGHRVSFSMITRECLKKTSLGRLSAEAAWDVWAADQRGCLSPAVIYVESSGEVSAGQFSESLAKAFLKLEKIKPKKHEAASERTILHRKIISRLELGRLTGKKNKYWASPRFGDWLVVYEVGNPEFCFCAGYQVIFVKAVSGASKVFQSIKPYARYLQAAALEASPKRRAQIAAGFSELGVNRVTRFGRLQKPPIFWHHDGYPNLSGWVRWTDLES